MNLELLVPKITQNIPGRHLGVGKLKSTRDVFLPLYFATHVLVEKQKGESVLPVHGNHPVA